MRVGHLPAIGDATSARGPLSLHMRLTVGLKNNSRPSVNRFRETVSPTLSIESAEQ
jgi:hypothetical protein